MNLIPRDALFDFDKVFGDFFGNMPAIGSTPDQMFAPRVDVHDKRKKYVIDAELPGVNKDDVSVTLDKGVLTIDATMEDETSKEEEGSVVRRERRFGRFSRSFHVGEGVREKDINARFKDGVLRLEVPKAEPEQPERKKIEVK